ncbi:MAG: hypothetical protein HGB12_10360, partial [Bacteroidetes bacterium]|nr:hypothetical protein [Bacteroidota bacterium]
MRSYKLVIICITFFALFSCTSEKNFIYLQNKNNNITPPTLNDSAGFDYILKPGDVLYIKVVPLDQNSAFSVNTESNNVNNYTSDLSVYVNSYNVDDSGYVRMPVIGKVQIKGLTISKSQEIIQKTVDAFLKNSLVVVKLMNFNITVLGEVIRPGIY